MVFRHAPIPRKGSGKQQQHEGSKNCAEHAVKLATDFNEVLTKYNHQSQLPHQAIEHHRKLLPTSASRDQLMQPGAVFVLIVIDF